MIALSVHVAGQSMPRALPKPTGKFSIGRVTLHWVDRSRIEPLAPDRQNRELMVDVWYPAEPSAGDAAEYLDVAAFERTLGADGFRTQFGAAYDIVSRGTVRTGALIAAPFAAAAERAPLLIFSPGGGMVREVYTAQLEDLASHGYVVAAISHPYDAIVTVFPDGRTIGYDSKRWPQVPSFEGEPNLNQLEWHADDVCFALDELSRANHAGPSKLPFAGHLDLARAGAFGHSFGGMAAAHACQKDQRLSACLDQDGEAGMRPFYLDPRGWGMDQAFMLMARAAPKGPVPDEELAKMKVTRRQAEEILARLRGYQDRALRSTGRGSYRVVLESKTTTHMDFSDLPALGARDATEAETRWRTLEVIRTYTRAFFDKYVRGAAAPFLAAKPAGELVESVEKFPPATPPCGAH